MTSGHLLLSPLLLMFCHYYCTTHILLTLAPPLLLPCLCRNPGPASRYYCGSDATLLAGGGAEGARRDQEALGRGREGAGGYYILEAVGRDRQG